MRADAPSTAAQISHRLNNTYYAKSDSLTLLLFAGFLGFPHGSDSCGCQLCLERGQVLALVGDPPFEPAQAALKDTPFTLSGRINGLSAGSAPRRTYSPILRHSFAHW